MHTTSAPNGYSPRRGGACTWTIRKPATCCSTAPPDPHELNSIATGNRSVVQQLRVMAAEITAACQQRAARLLPSRPHRSAPLSQQALRALRALGYVGDGDEPEEDEGRDVEAEPDEAEDQNTEPP